MKAPAEPDPARASKLLRGFDRNAKPRQRSLDERWGKGIAEQVTREARQEYRRLIPEVAGLGGGILNGALAGTYEYLAYYKVLRGRGRSVDEIGTFFGDSYQALVDRFPAWLLRLGFRLAQPFLRARLRREAAASQRSDDPDAWRFEFVEGRAGRHDFGMDITNCAVCAAYARHDASEIVPYLCALDDRMSATLDMGLRRSGTRALGSKCCDFRYQAGGEPRALSSQYSLPVVSSQAGGSDSGR